MRAPLAERQAMLALSTLPDAGPRRLAALVGDDGAAAALDRLRAPTAPVVPALEGCAGRGGPKALLERWRAAARALDVEGLWRHHVDHGVAVLLPGDDRWPLAEDPEPPALLCCLGDTELLLDERPRAAVVGTRRCTAYGVEVATDLGATLAGAGVSVVSGLAIGIDGAAHVGSLRSRAEVGVGAPPIGVAATGLDVAYPRRHRQLWRRVAADGLLLAEVPLGTAPTRWAFPARNRIIAGLSAAVVVVESAPRGGSMHTVDEAVARDRPVLAVPGPVTSAASAGTNRLIADGAAPLCSADDVLDVLGLGRGAAAGAPPAPPPPAGDAARLLAAMDWRPDTVDNLVLRSGLELGRVSLGVLALERDGWVRLDGGWIERRR